MGMSKLGGSYFGVSVVDTVTILSLRKTEMRVTHLCCR